MEPTNTELGTVDPNYLYGRLVALEGIVTRLTTLAIVSGVPFDGLQAEFQRLEGMAPTIVRSLADELAVHGFGPDFYAAFEAGFQDCISRLNNGLPRD